MTGFPGTPALRHLRRLTDDTGLFQHAHHEVANPHHGYTLDDNARALTVAAGLAHAGVPATDLMERYLRFCVLALEPDGRFRNELGYDRRWLDEEATEDARGHAVAALGYTAARAPDRGSAEAARALVHPALEGLELLRHPRGVAHCLIGLCWLGAPGVVELADRLVDWHDANRAPGWEWYEPWLTYDNARLPLALLLAHAATGERRFASVARTTLDFYLGVVWVDGLLDLVGNGGWYPRGGPRAAFDQQPVDAASVVEACVAAAVLLGDDRYRGVAEGAARWFTGANRLGVALLDPATGGCHDGLQPDGVNRNQGAESALAPLQAWLALADAGWVVPSPKR